MKIIKYSLILSFFISSICFAQEAMDPASPGSSPDTTVKSKAKDGGVSRSKEGASQPSVVQGTDIKDIKGFYLPSDMPPVPKPKDSR